MRLAATLALLAALMVPAPVLAKDRVYAPPGNSGVNQYVENVPTAGGNKPASSVHPGAGAPGGRGGGGGGPVSSSTQRKFDSQGAAGRAAVALAQATAPGSLPKPRNGVRSNEPGAGGSSPASAASTQGFSPLRSLFKTLTGSASGGLGALLPIILVITALGAMMLAVIRRRRAT